MLNGPNLITWLPDAVSNAALPLAEPVSRAVLTTPVGLVAPGAVSLTSPPFAVSATLPAVPEVAIEPPNAMPPPAVSATLPAAAFLAAMRAPALWLIDPACAVSATLGVPATAPAAVMAPFATMFVPAVSARSPDVVLVAEMVPPAAWLIDPVCAVNATLGVPATAPAAVTTPFATMFVPAVRARSPDVVLVAEMVPPAAWLIDPACAVNATLGVPATAPAAVTTPFATMFVPAVRARSPDVVLVAEMVPPAPWLIDPACAVSATLGVPATAPAAVMTPFATMSVAACQGEIARSGVGGGDDPPHPG